MPSSHHKIQAALEKKSAQREKKRKPKMKVSGKAVFKLQTIIRNKSQQ